MTTDRPFLGIILMLGFCCVAPLADAAVKYIGDTIPLGQLVLIRFAVQTALLLPLVVLGRARWRMSRRVLAVTFLRTLLHILGIAMMVAALHYLPLADAVAISFVMPFMMLVLGRYVLNETVGRRRLIACIVGFAGTLMVVQPSFVDVGWPALLPLGVALNFSVFMLITRTIAKKTDPIGLQAVSGVMALILMAPILLFGPSSGVAILHLVAPTPFEWTILLGIGVLGTIAHLLMTWSLRYAPSSTVAPIQYLEIPVAALLGWVVFHDWPNGLALFGIGVTIAAGLYIMMCEQANARLAARQERQQHAAIPSPAE